MTSASSLCTLQSSGGEVISLWSKSQGTLILLQSARACLPFCVYAHCFKARELE